MYVDDETDARVVEFEDGVKRSIEQYKAGQVQMFDKKARLVDRLCDL